MPHMQLLPKDVRDNVLVFHRGIGVAEHKDMFINDKIDLLVEYLVVNPGTRVRAMTHSMFRL